MSTILYLICQHFTVAWDIRFLRQVHLVVDDLCDLLTEVELLWLFASVLLVGEFEFDLAEKEVTIMEDFEKLLVLLHLLWFLFLFLDRF
jgi:hypothetical protein